MAVRSPATSSNREPFLRVMRKHRDAIKDINPAHVPADLLAAARQAWDEAVELGERARLPQRPGDGPRADRHHRLHDGLRHHRRRAGHRAGQVQEAGRRRHDEDRQPDGPRGARPARLHPRTRSATSSPTSIANETIEGAPHLREDDLPVFDCAFKPARGERSIHYMGHIKMMGAAQPFISGAISKTVNVPKDATVGRDRAGLHRVVEARREGHRHLPRRQQADAAAQHDAGTSRRPNW